MRNRKIAVACSMMLGVALLFNNCSEKKGTSTGNPVVSLQFAAYDPAALSKAIQDKSSSASSTTIGVQSINSLTMCFKRLRLKVQTTDPDDSGNIDLELGEVTLSPTGTDLGDIELPKGTYTRVEFDLDDHCPSGKSVQVSNASGSYSTNDGIKIRFDGNVTLDENSQGLLLMIQAITGALNGVASDNDIRNEAESVSGSF